MNEGHTTKYSRREGKGVTIGVETTKGKFTVERQ